MFVTRFLFNTDRRGGSNSWGIPTNFSLINYTIFLLKAADAFFRNEQIQNGFNMLQGSGDFFSYQTRDFPIKLSGKVFQEILDNMKTILKKILLGRSGGIPLGRSSLKILLKVRGNSFGEARACKRNDPYHSVPCRGKKSKSLGASYRIYFLLGNLHSRYAKNR